MAADKERTYYPSHGGNAGLCEGRHYCEPCRWGGCALGDVCLDIHRGEDCGDGGCGLDVACDCEPCAEAGNAGAG